LQCAIGGKVVRDQLNNGVRFIIENCHGDVLAGGLLQ
jgi:hypothetical protein